jgi:hypothetical protein
VTLFCVASNGNVGIGTNASPNNALTVVAGGNAVTVGMYAIGGSSMISGFDKFGTVNAQQFSSTQGGYGILYSGTSAAPWILNRTIVDGQPIFQLSGIGGVADQFDTNGLVHLPSEAYYLTNLTTSAGTNVWNMPTNRPAFLTCGTTAQALQISLPTPTSTIAGMVFRVIDKAGTAATRNITVSATNVFGQSQTINGASTYTISANYGICFAMCDGANYFIIGK